MFKLIRKTILLIVVVSVVSMVFLMPDRISLKDQLIRFHVIAESDDPEAQAVKLQVRDALLNKIENLTRGISNPEDARAWIRDNLPMLEQTANEVLEGIKGAPKAVVTFMEEAYPTREYDTFSLPAGVYDSLKVTIGRGEGQNWWCVVFPQLCIPAASGEVVDVAVSAGFSEELSQTLVGDNGYEIRFWLLDCMGKIQNFLHGIQ